MAQGFSQNFFDFGSVENEISHIQQAYSADGYILQTDPYNLDFSTITEPEQYKKEGLWVFKLRTVTFNINDEDSQTITPSKIIDLTLTYYILIKLIET